jgi:hypothetical protein
VWFLTILSIDIRIKSFSDQNLWKVASDLGKKVNLENNFLPAPAKDYTLWT